VSVLPISRQPALAARTASLRRAYQRALRAKPTLLEAYHLGYAASLTARAEQAAGDKPCRLLRRCWLAVLVAEAEESYARMALLELAEEFRAKAQQLELRARRTTRWTNAKQHEGDLRPASCTARAYRA
jgi:hypothetical protein